MAPLTLTPHRRRLVLGFVEFAVSIGVLVLPLMMGGEQDGARADVLLFSCVAAASLIVRRAWPLIAVLVFTLGAAGLVLVAGEVPPVVIVILPLMYSVGRRRGARTSIVAWLVGLATATVAAYVWTGGFPHSHQFLAATSLSVSAFAGLLSAWLLGRMVGLRRRTDELERQRAEESFRFRSQVSTAETELATGRARSEVARELHDVVAHSLSIIVVQAEGAKALSAKKPEAARQALEVIAETGRGSIDEMRRIVGLLRGETQAAFGPTPSLAQIPELVRSVGDRVALEMPDELPIVPDSVGLAAFRIVQESITNVLKHAGPTAAAKVRLDVGPPGITILVVDDGLGAQSGKAPGTGSGVKGMEERVHALGGTFSAGPRSGGGFQVRALIPRPAKLGQSWISKVETS